MGNLQKHAGPLSPSWHQAQYQLAKQIIQRMTEIGIIPVLPAFTGFMPQTAPKYVKKAFFCIFMKRFDLSRRFPTAKFHYSSNWVDFGCNESWFVLIFRSIFSMINLYLLLS